MKRKIEINSFIQLNVICDSDVCMGPWKSIKCRNKKINETKFIEKSIILAEQYTLECLPKVKPKWKNSFIVV